jgi:hypothetical protein
VKKLYVWVMSVMFAICALSLTACAGGSGKVYAVTYDGVKTLGSIGEIGGYTVAATNNDAAADGIVASPYFTLEINGAGVPVYGARTTNGIHSFSYVDVEREKGGEFLLNIRLTVSDSAAVLEKPSPTVTVLPESAGVSATLKNRVVSAKLKKTGSFSFVFNKGYTEAFTLFVAEYEVFSAPDGYQTTELAPGEHTAKETNFTQGETVYRFKAGRHKTDVIRLPADSVLYFEPGAYIEVTPVTTGGDGYAIRGVGKNIRVAGRGLIDMSACPGGDRVAGGRRPGISFYGAKNVSVEGLTIINSHTWTLTFSNCETVKVKNNLLLGYRTYSDGIMLSDCRDGIVEDCFVRTGDDAVEVKSASDEGTTDNILFQRCAVWTDKASAYGAIYETNRDIKNVTFRDCSVGFAVQASINAGPMVIQQGRTPNTKIHDIRFENIEVYTTYNPVINITIRSYGGNSIYGNIYDIYFKNITVAHNRSGVAVNVRSDNTATGKIGAIYVDSLTTDAGGFTADDIATDAVKTHAGWDTSNLKVNTLS